MIYSFRGMHSFLSNFYREVDGSCVEIEFQRAKCILPDQAALFNNFMTPGEAKKLGKQVKLRPDWESTKLVIMEQLVYEKFKDDPYLRQLLVQTHPAELVEENSWRDTFWGIYNGFGENHLGKILMKVRAQAMKKESEE